MQTENDKSLSNEECAWKFSTKGNVHSCFLFAFSLCLDEQANSIWQWFDKEISLVNNIFFSGNKGLPVKIFAKMQPMLHI